MTSLRSGSHEQVWNEQLPSRPYRQSQEAHTAAVLEQWRVCVETTERTRTLRVATNAFFLALNTAILAFVGTLWRSAPPQGFTDTWLVLLWLAIEGACCLWYGLLRSYNLLNEAKFVVVLELERQLPARVFGYEYELLARRTGRRAYLRFTKLERLVPVLFSLVYAVALVFELLAGA